jgi:hypothetical protein
MNLRRLSLAFTFTVGLSALAAGTASAAVVPLSSGQAAQMGGASGPTVISKSIARSVAAVPEPSQWLMMILGVGLVGIAARAKRRVPALAVAADA